MYKVIVQFTDLQDNNHKYLPGETFPRAGLDVSKARLEELSTDKNRRHKPMIELVEDAVRKPEKSTKTEIPEEAKATPKTSGKEPIKEDPVEKPKPKRGRKKKDAE